MQVLEAVRAAEAALGPIDLAVANAGVATMGGRRPAAPRHAILLKPQQLCICRLEMCIMQVEQTSQARCIDHLPHAGTFLEAPVSAFEATNRINYLGVVHTLKAVLPGMVERCVHKPQSASLHMAGLAGWRCMKGKPAYI